MSPYALHVRDWKTCQRCPLCQGRQNVVLCRGQLPCDVLFIGEAPGESEDVLGKPFVGPAGHLLDQIIEASIGQENRFRAAAKGAREIRYALTNLIACIPYIEEGTSKKASEPPEESILACKPRLEQFIVLAKPRVIVCVGKLSETWMKQGYKSSVKAAANISQVAIVHPAYILRGNEAQKGLAIQRCVVTVRNAVRDL